MGTLLHKTNILNREMKSLKFSIFNLQQTNHITLHEFQFLFFSSLCSFFLFRGNEPTHKKKWIKNSNMLKSVFSNQIYYVLCVCFIEVAFAHWNMQICALTQSLSMYAMPCHIVTWFLIMLWYLTMCIIDEHVSFTKICLKMFSLLKNKILFS